MFWHGKQMYRRLSEEVRAARLAAGDAVPQPVTLLLPHLTLKIEFRIGDRSCVVGSSLKYRLRWH